MASVTQVAFSTPKPGRFIKAKDFSEISFCDNINLNSEENITTQLMGLVVEYLVHIMLGTPAEEVFKYSIMGYEIRAKLKTRLSISELIKLNKVVHPDLDFINCEKQKGIDIYSHIEKIKGLDEVSIDSACKCASFDMWYRNPKIAERINDDILLIKPDPDTIENIRIMVNRSLDFWKIYGPVVRNGFDFMGETLEEGYTGGYSGLICTGDGDFLTADTIWDFKVSSNKPRTIYAFQLLLYWILSQHTPRPEFKNIDKIGIYNPRLNKAYIYEMANMSKEIIKEVEDTIICYDHRVFTPGDRIKWIKCDEFGEGTVISTAPHAMDTSLQIRFDSGIEFELTASSVEKIND